MNSLLCLARIVFQAIFAQQHAHMQIRNDEAVECVVRAIGIWKAQETGTTACFHKADGTAVERNLVRTTLVLDWSAAGAHTEIRPLGVPEGAQPARLRVVGWLEDARAHVVAVAQSVCAPSED